MRAVRRSLSFVLIVVVTASVAVGAFLVVEYLVHKDDIDIGAAEAALQQDFQRSLDRRTRDTGGSILVRSVDCIETRSGNLRCIAKLSDGQDTAQATVNVDVGKDGRYFWEAQDLTP